MLTKRKPAKKPAIFRKLDEDFWIAGCLDEKDIARAAAEGFATIINILPEDDELCRMSDSDAQTASRDNGLSYFHMPLYGHQLNNEYFARAFSYLEQETTGPKLVYCRTGMRCAFIWGMIRAASLGVDEVLDRTLDIGFDLAVIEEEMTKIANKQKTAGAPREDAENRV